MCKNYKNYKINNNNNNNNNNTLLNVNISTNCSAWSQASLPIRKGGLGFRSAVQLAPSCYLSSATAFADLVDLLLIHSCTHTSTVSQSLVQEAKSLWSHGLPPIDPPSGGDASVQRAWDDPVVECSFDLLVASAPDDFSQPRLLAVSAPESGAWLQDLPVSFLGLRLDDSVMRVCFALRFGLATCVQHSCRNCSAAMDRLGHHGLVCKKGGGRYHCHAAVNDVIHRALAAAGVPSRFEPTGLSCSDGKHPDGLSLIPWERDRPLVLDVTVPDSLAVLYRLVALSGVGFVATFVQSKKISKYSHLPPSYLFCPIAIESLGALGAQSSALICELGKRIRHRSAEESAFPFLLQRLSIAVQRGNASLIIDTLPSSFDTIFPYN